jgi:hypothetical protein
VRSEIEALLRTQEAPAYTAARAQELYSEWKAGKIALADVAVKLKGTVLKTDNALTALNDPKPELQGLSAAILEQSEQKKQLQELRDQYVFVEIEKYTEPNLPAFDAIRDRVILAIKSRDADQATKKLAHDLLVRIQKGEDFKSVVEGAKLSVEKKEKVNGKTLSAPLSDPKLASALSESPSAGKVLSEVYQGENGYLLAAITAVNLPTEEIIKTKLPQYKEQADSAVSNLLLSSLINQLKASGKVDFDQSILTN